MKLYNGNFSPNALRVRAVAFELDLDLESVEVDVRGGENRADWFLAINPNGKVPVLVDGDFVLWESRAINGYLASLRPERGLYPEGARRRAVVDQWSYWQAIHLGPAMQGLAFERFVKAKYGMGAPDEAAAAAHLKNVAQFLPVLDAGIGAKDWIAGDLSVADFALATTFVGRGPAGIGLDDAPNVAAWIERLEARPSWRKAVAPMRAMLGL